MDSVNGFRMCQCFSSTVIIMNQNFPTLSTKKVNLGCFVVKILNLVFFGVKNLEVVCFWCQLKMVPVSTK